MKNTIKPLTIVWATFIAWVIYMANTGQDMIFFEWVKAMPFGDKLGHFLLFGILTICLNMATSFKRIRNGRLIYVGTVLISAFVLLEELSQYFIRFRTLDITDLTADAIGILIFTLLSYYVERAQLSKGMELEP